ncbi:hypothetical protein B0H34DRAFT_353973 [Crassisporium funariophilum]|nr:hypothetical protein B0H34DRAFT_353973 [Crassisporium funariophilum]
MNDRMSYSTTNQYLPPAHPQYYPSSNVNHSGHIVPPPPRPEIAQRKRPKYTRSKTGCMTCRVKKIKCDETKPNCMRCTHGSRECSWPEGVPVRKKASVRKDSLDGRPSTAGSSGLSEASTPPTREHTPPSRQQADLNLLPLPSRASSETFIHMQPMGSEHDSRRQLERNPGYATHPPNPNVLSMIPETSYPSRYDHTYLNATHPGQASRHTVPTPYRPSAHQPAAQWHPPSESLESYKEH